jgi:hypothetical protein
MRVLAALSALLIFQPLSASLTWESLTFNVKAAPTDTQCVVVFPFVNSGEGTVTIDSVQSSCGCTTVELAKTKYAPGQKGEIRAVFTFGDRVGEQHKTVTVVESEGEKPATVLLEMFVVIPETVTLEPRVQTWTKGGPCEEKSLVIRIAKDFPGVPYSVQMFSPRSNFRPGDVEKVSEGTYHIRIAPLSTGEILNEAGEVCVDVKGAEPRKILFYASVRP